MPPLGPFYGERFDARISGVFLDPLRDALHLAVGAAGADDKVIRDGRVVVNIEHDKVAGFSVEGETDEQKGFFPGTLFRQIHPRRPRPPSR